jgi:hypothetical protein
VKVTTPAARPTVPLVAPPTAVTVGVLSRSVSLARSVATGMRSALSSSVVAVSSTATGGSSTAVTVTVTRPVSDSTPSDTV